MDHPEITHHEDGDFVSVWIGQFRDHRDFSNYMEPDYSDESDDLPLSAFAADIGLVWYDEDFVESDFLKAPTSDVAKALTGCSYSESFLPAIIATHNLLVFNAFVLIYGYDHARYPQHQTLPLRVKYLGTFSYDPERSTLERLEILEESRAAGRISEVEYQAQRRVLLGSG